MAQSRQRLQDPRQRPLSADFVQQPKQSSMLYSILPIAVQSRLPRLPSLRKSVSMYGLATRRNGSRSASGSSTPDTGYAMVLSGPRGVGAAHGEETPGYVVEQVSSDEDMSHTSSNKCRQSMELSESKSGIQWKFANQGLNLLSLAVEESSTISRDPRFGNASFARQLYLHSLTYLLRALPSDLTTEEQMSVRGALPSGVVESLQLEVSAARPAQSYQNAGGVRDQPSLLHRTLASTIVQMFILFQFVLPYLKFLLSAAFQYERTHKISEKVFSRSIDTADTLRKRGVLLTGAIYEMGDGKVGQAISDAATWFVEGVTGGIHDGVGAGMVILGARRNSRMVE